MRTIEAEPARPTVRANDSALRDWVRALEFLGATDLTSQAADDTLGAVVKDRDDLELVRQSLAEITSGA